MRSKTIDISTIKDKRIVRVLAIFILLSLIATSFLGMAGVLFILVTEYILFLSSLIVLLRSKAVIEYTASSKKANKTSIKPNQERLLQRGKVMVWIIGGVMIALSVSLIFMIFELENPSILLLIPVAIIIAALLLFSRVNQTRYFYVVLSILFFLLIAFTSPMLIAGAAYIGGLDVFIILLLIFSKAIFMAVSSIVMFKSKAVKEYMSK